MVKVVTIRQGLAQGVFRSLPDGEPSRQSCIQHLIQLFGLLLPRSMPQMILRDMSKLIDKAIALKTEIMEEPAIYRVFMVNCGDTVADVRNNIQDLEETNLDNGLILMCTSPGLEKLTCDMNGKRSQVVVRASIELDLRNSTERRSGV